MIESMVQPWNLHEACTYTLLDGRYMVIGPIKAPGTAISTNVQHPIKKFVLFVKPSIISGFKLFKLFKSAAFGCK